MKQVHRNVSAFVLCLGAVPAQQHHLDTTFAARPGEVITTVIRSAANQPYLTLVDLDGGPVQMFGESIYLGLTPNLTIVDRGQMPSVGGLSRNYRLPSAIPPGLQLYFQSLLVDPKAPNGMFRASDGETTTVYLARHVMGADIKYWVNNDFTGTFDKSVLGRLMAAKVTKRVVTYIPQLSFKFPQPVGGDLDQTGVRIQKVYRAIDLGATGQPEVLTAIHWQAHTQSPVVDQILPSMAIDVSHSDVVPDFTIDYRTAFPKFPNSGLVTTFAKNRSDAPVRVFSGVYSIRASSSRGGFVRYPNLQREFVYDGTSSLLLDFATDPAPLAKGFNGQQVYLMTVSSPRPNVRATTNGVTDPSQQLQAIRADNAQTGMRFEFAQVHSEALSGWLSAPKGTPDYQTPYLGISVPAGSSIEVDYRGTKAVGGVSTPWSKDINIADGMPFVQFRVKFRASTSGARPSLDALVIPVN